MVTQRRDERGRYLPPSTENLPQFTGDVLRIARDLTKQQLQPFVKKIALQVLRGVVLKSPVDTGRFRANWQVSIGSPIETELDAVEPRRVNQGGGDTLAKGRATILNAPQIDVVWLSNNVPYAERLENGYSKQAASGVVAVTLEEIRQQFGN